MIVPFFLISEGGLNDRAESLPKERLTPEHSELFLMCWEQNLERSDTFIKEHFVTKSGNKGYGPRLVFSDGIKQAKKLIRKCQNDYECDVPII